MNHVAIVHELCTLLCGRYITYATLVHCTYMYVCVYTVHLMVSIARWCNGTLRGVFGHIGCGILGYGTDAYSVLRPEMCPLPPH